MRPLLSRDQVHERLQAIFPDGAPNRAYMTRMLAASTVFTVLYIDAIDGTGTFLGPKHVYRMTDEQAAQDDDASRADYAVGVLRTGSRTEGRRWYQDNTREPTLALTGGVRRSPRQDQGAGNRHWALLSRTCGESPFGIALRDPEA